MIASSLLIAACARGDLDAARRLEAEGRLRAAGAAFQRLAESDPANLAAWDGAVRIWCRRLAAVGRCAAVLGEERARIGRVERHEAALFDALVGRAHARIDAGLIAAAADDIARAEKMRMASPRLVAAKARLALRTNAPDQARNHLQAGLNRWPDAPELQAVAQTLETRRDQQFGGEAVPAKDGAPKASN